MPWLSPRQAEFHADRSRVRLAVGAVRSAKTHVCAFTFMDYLATQEPSTHLVVGASVKQLEEEVLPHFEDYAAMRGHGCRYYGGSKRYFAYRGHRLMFFQHTNRESKKLIRGFTARTGYGEECALWDEKYWNEVLSRLSLPGSRFVGNCNPEGPGHWLKQRIDRGGIAATTFTMRDNPSMTPYECGLIESGYVPGTADHARMVLGQWAAAEGRIWRDFTTSALPPARGRETASFAGIDSGVHPHPSAIVRVQERTFAGDASYYVTHGRHIGGGNVAMMASATARRIMDFYEEAPFEVAFIDPSAAGLKAELRALEPPFAVRNGYNERSVGLSAVGRLLTSGAAVIRDHDDTADLRTEILGYIWHPTKPDEPLKENDDACDALRYALASWTTGRVI